MLFYFFVILRISSIPSLFGIQGKTPLEIAIDVFHANKQVNQLGDDNHQTTHNGKIVIAQNRVIALLQLVQEIVQSLETSPLWGKYAEVIKLLEGKRQLL